MRARTQIYTQRVNESEEQEQTAKMGKNDTRERGQKKEVPNGMNNAKKKKMGRSKNSNSITHLTGARDKLKMKIAGVQTCVCTRRAHVVYRAPVRSSRTSFTYGNMCEIQVYIILISLYIVNVDLQSM